MKKYMNIVTFTTVKKHLDLDDKYNERVLSINK